MGHNDKHISMTAEFGWVHLPHFAGRLRLPQGLQVRPRAKKELPLISQEGEKSQTITT